MDGQNLTEGEVLRRWRVVALLLLSLAVAALYAPSARFRFVHDDGRLILGQAMPHTVWDVAKVFAEPHWTGLPYYRPVTRATMVVQKWVHGDSPAPFHVFNIGLMGIAALLAYALLRIPVFRVRRGPALLGAALFAMHPIASTTVYPICSGRETLLPTVLILAAVYAFLRPGAAWYAAAMLLTALSLLAKEMAAILPVLFVLADALGLTADPPGRDPRRWVRRYAPVGAILAGYLAIRWALFEDSELHQIALLERPFYPLLTLVYTLQTTFAPFSELVYEPRLPAWWSPWRLAVWVPAVAALALGVLRIGRPLAIPVAFWIGWWVVAQLPTANILRQESPFAERYGFLSLLGVVGVAMALASMAWDRPLARRAMVATAAVLIAVLGTLSFLRGSAFRNDYAFSIQWVRTDPGSFKAQLHLGHGFVENRRWKKAVDHLTKASYLRPNDAIAQNGLGYALWMNRDLDRAAIHLQRAVSLAPDLAVARDNLGDVLAERGDLRRALMHYEAALRINPRDERARRGRARALERLE